MKILNAKQGCMLVWKDRRTASYRFYTPDTFDESVLEEMAESDARILMDEWEAEDAAEAAEPPVETN